MCLCGTMMCWHDLCELRSATWALLWRSNQTFDLIPKLKVKVETRNLKPYHKKIRINSAKKRKRKKRESRLVSMNI